LSRLMVSPTHLLRMRKEFLASRPRFLTCPVTPSPSVAVKQVRVSYGRTGQCWVGRIPRSPTPAEDVSAQRIGCEQDKRRARHFHEGRDHALGSGRVRPPRLCLQLGDAHQQARNSNCHFLHQCRSGPAGRHFTLALCRDTTKAMQREHVSLSRKIFQIQETPCLVARFRTQHQD